MAKFNKVSKASVAETVAIVASVAETVASPAIAETVASPAKPNKYTKWAAANAEIADIAALVKAKHGGALWAMPTHGSAAKGIAATVNTLWLAAYAASGNQTPPAEALPSAVVALCTKHPQVKGGKGQNYSTFSTSIAEGKANAVGVAWALGYLCYTGKKTKGKALI